MRNSIKTSSIWVAAHTLPDLMKLSAYLLLAFSHFDYSSLFPSQCYSISQDTVKRHIVAALFFTLGYHKKLAIICSQAGLFHLGLSFQPVFLFSDPLGCQWLPLLAKEAYTILPQLVHSHIQQWLDRLHTHRHTLDGSGLFSVLEMDNSVGS